MAQDYMQCYHKISIGRAGSCQIPTLCGFLTKKQARFRHGHKTVHSWRCMAFSSQADGFL